MEPPGYKLVMNKFRLTIRKFLIIGGIKFCELSDGRGSGQGTFIAPLWSSVGEERGNLEGLGLFSCPHAQGLLCIHFLMIQSNSPGAELLTGFE